MRYPFTHTRQRPRNNDNTRWATTAQPWRWSDLLFAAVGLLLATAFVGCFFQ